MSEPWLAMVDVEGFVAGGAPRNAFVLNPATDGSLPTWSIDEATLREAGWIMAETSWQPPPSHQAVPRPHPYDLGPAWTGANTWHAAFVVHGRMLRCTVDHELMPVRQDDDCDPGPPLPSASPWRWHTIADRIHRCGRAESPIEAACVVEHAMRAAGADDFEPTRLTRPFDPDH